VRFSTYRTSGGSGVGVWDGDRLHPLPGVTRLVDLLGDEGTRLRTAGQAALAQPPLEHTPAELLAPVPEPPSIRDFMAFEEHVATASAALDYELEVAALIGREGADLTPAEAVRHIAGFMLFCDWSARDLQGAEMRLNLGPAKGKDSANSFGPWLVTADELAPLTSRRGYDVPLSASVNGAPYSRGNLADLYWSFGEMIAYASRGTRVRPGDVIGSGTVGTGCILELSRVHGAAAYPYLRPGDQVRLDGGPLGAIDARVTAGRPAVPLRPHPVAERAGTNR
jgi:2-keto-4-pentenoate hydratase/2-oxohepta-3-ene-1,7-dioic acid hydratase in catechol pathway